MNVPVEDEDNDNKKIDSEEEEEEAMEFTSEVHANFFRDVFRKYNLKLEEWVVCQVSVLF